MAVMMEARSFRPFKSSEEYLYAMKEDLAEWLNTLYPELMINVDNFMDRLDTGVALCKHANNVRESAIEYENKRAAKGLPAKCSPLSSVSFFPAARPATFFARDNVSNFITWCRNPLCIFECLLFETDDLILRKNEKHVILCLLEVARKGSKFGMLAPMLVQMERQIDREIMADARRAGQGVLDSEEEEDDSAGQEAPPMMYGPMPQIVTNDLKSLDEMVRDLVERCTCPTQFPMIRVSEGKYRIGDTKVLIFVRVLRSHVMVRVGGGWDTLSHYLDKHDPCRCRSQHRATHAARVVQRYPPAAAGLMDLNGAEVHYDRSPPRTRRSSVSSVGSSGGGSPQHVPTQLGPPQHTAARQRSRSPAARGHASLPYMGHANNAFENQAFNHLAADNAYYQSKLNRRSVSPSPARKFSQNNRAVSPNPTKKVINLTNPSLVLSDSLVPSPHRNNRSRSPTPKVPTLNIEKKTISPDKESLGVFDGHNCDGTSTTDNIGSNSENASDNGSEVSDEGYRSLGLIQQGNGSTQTSPPSASSNCKDISIKIHRLSVGSQASTDDADMIERPDAVTNIETTFSHLFTNEDKSKYDVSSVGKSHSQPYEEVSSITGLRKTNYSENLYGTDKKANPSYLEKKSVINTNSPIYLETNDSPSKSLQKSATSSKIPNSPILSRRRLSVENLSPQNRSRSASFDRSMNREKSMTRDSPSPIKKPMPSAKSKDVTSSKPPTVPANSPTGNNTGSFGRGVNSRTASPSGNFTWNGRSPMPKGKARPAINNETYVSPNGKVLATNKTNSPVFHRNSNFRSSTSGVRNMNGYDHNGRKIKTSPKSSPDKQVKNANPILDEILKKTANVKDETLVIETLKNIIKEYSSVNGAMDEANYSDFTKAWVHSNGTLERSQSTIGVSTDLDESSELKSAALVNKVPMFTPRKDSKAGIVSRIPAPISTASFKKSSDFYD